MTLLFLVAAFAGTPLRSAADGFELTVPDGWKVAPQGGVWLVGSDTEAGLVVVAYTPGLGLEAMRAQAAAGVQEQGVSLTPAAPPTERAVGSARALVADYQGLAADGTALRAHAVGVAGPGGGLVAMGVTTPEQIARLAPTVDALAGSATFFAPERGSVGLLSGTLCAWSGGSSFSSTRRMSFDGQGHVGWGSELVGGGEIRDGGGNTTSTWSAVAGDQGRTVGSYAVTGEEVVIRWPDGTEQRCAVHHRRSDGGISELKCGSDLYGAPLCG